jgi:hypothetical protein
VSLDDTLLKTDPSQYGSLYLPHLLDQYKLYVEMADKISERRSTANSFFLSANTLLVSLYGILGAAVEGATASASTTSRLGLWLYSVPVAGLLLSVTWATLIKSYRQMNAGKFIVVHALESRLPAALYKAEWQALGEGKSHQYLPFTHVEAAVPWIFSILYVLLGGYALTR